MKRLAWTNYRFLLLHAERLKPRAAPAERARVESVWMLASRSHEPANRRQYRVRSNLGIAPIPIGADETSAASGYTL